MPAQMSSYLSSPANSSVILGTVLTPERTESTFPMTEAEFSPIEIEKNKKILFRQDPT